jgi:YfiH family protein
MTELKKWHKITVKKAEWYEFFFSHKVKIIQGTRNYNPLTEVNGEIFDLIQIHSGVIHKAGSNIKLVGDGLFTKKKDMYLYVRTADCLPIIFYHSGRKILALLHAGWKGTALMIAKNFLLKMRNLYNIATEDWEVSLGPCICADNYEVGEVVFDFFKKSNIEGVKVRNKRYFLDLEEANIAIVKKCGVVKIYPFPEKTYASDLFYSYRRGDTDRNITVGVIES